MAVRQMNNYVSKLIELWNLGYDAQLVFTCVDGHMGINLQQSILACETVSHRYSQNEYHGRKPTQPKVRRREPQVRRREQPAKRRRHEKRASARERVGEAAAQVPSSHQLPVQPGATSHAPPASAPSFLPPFLPPAEPVWHDSHPPLLPLAEQAGDQQDLPCPRQPTEEVRQDLRPHSPATEAFPPLPTVKQPGQSPHHPSEMKSPVPFEQGGQPPEHPQPVLHPYLEHVPATGQQSRHPPPPPAENHHPALLPYQELVPVTCQQAQHPSPPPLREQEHFPPVVPTWPGHYQTSDMAFTSPNPAFPLLPPALYQVEKVSEQAVPLPPPQPGTVRVAQETDGSVLQLYTHHEHVMRSFCFLSPKDSSLLPLPPALRVRRAYPPPPRRRILRNSLVRMKPARISLNQSIDKGVKRFYISGVWVGHVCKFMHFVNSSDDVFRAEPTLVYKDPGPLPPLGPLGSQQVTDRPPHPEDADEYLG